MKTKLSWQSTCCREMKVRLRELKIETDLHLHMEESVGISLTVCLEETSVKL